VGTKLITGGETPALGGVYKMSALEEHGVLTPKMKFSDNPEKVTVPGKKELYRVYDDQGMAFADLITLADEVIDEVQPLTLFDPKHTWKRTTMTGYRLQKMLQPFWRGGRYAGPSLSVHEISDYRARQERHIWEEQLRPVNPEPPKVDLSQKLWDLRHDLLLKGGKEGA